MRYLTKEWYELSQQTGLQFGLEADEKAARFSEELYREKYQFKEEEYVKLQHEVYDCDPREFLKEDGAVFVPAHKFIQEEELKPEDFYVFHMPEKEKNRIQKLVQEYDARPPFNEEKARKEFIEMQKDIVIRRKKELQTYGLLERVADPRVFALGYCTADILEDLTKISEKNKEEVNRIMEACEKAAKEEQIPDALAQKFGFHDCEIIDLDMENNITFHFDTDGGFSTYDTITFVDATVIKMEEPILKSTWIYSELYRIKNGYEAHMLLWGERILEVTISCKDIVIERLGEKPEECMTSLLEDSLSHL